MVILGETEEAYRLEAGEADVAGDAMGEKDGGAGEREDVTTPALFDLRENQDMTRGD